MNNLDVHIDSIEGYGPVVATGTIQGKPFDFYARRDGWAFAVALTDKSNLLAATRSDEHTFYLEGDYGAPDRFDASYMLEEDVKKIIHDCAAKFVQRSR